MIRGRTSISSHYRDNFYDHSNYKIVLQHGRIRAFSLIFENLMQHSGRFHPILPHSPSRFPVAPPPDELAPADGRTSVMCRLRSGAGTVIASSFFRYLLILTNRGYGCVCLRRRGKRRRAFWKALPGSENRSGESRGWPWPNQGTQVRKRCEPTRPSSSGWAMATAPSVGGENDVEEQIARPNAKELLPNRLTFHPTRNQSSKLLKRPAVPNERTPSSG